MIRTLLALVTCVTLSAVVPMEALALQPGDSVTFLIPATENQPQPPEGPADKLIFIGGPTTTIDVAGCGGTGSRPVQNAVLVDPAGGRSGRIVGVIVLSQTDPVPPGTKLTDLTVEGSCVVLSNLTPYIRYTGQVE